MGNQTIETYKGYYQSALNAKNDVDGRIREYNSYYDGEFMQQPDVSRSQFVSRDVQRTIEGMIPNLTEPFLSTPESVLAEPLNGNDDTGARIQSNILNKQFNGLDKNMLFEDIARTLTIEGTVWVRTGWNEDTNTLEKCDNVDVFPDPSARTESEMQYLVYRRRVSKRSIEENKAWYSNGFEIDKTELDYNESNQNEKEIGYENSFNFEQGDSKELVTIYEYYGYDEDGKAVIVIWSGDAILRNEESPYPEAIPFKHTVFIKKQGSLWGLSMIELLQDTVRVRTGIMRGILDNMNMSNNAQQFIAKGSLDYVNWKRMVNGDRHIETNKQIDIVDGNYNDIPSSVSNLMETLQQDQETLTGITRFTTGTDPKALNSTARGISSLSSMAEQRTLQVVRKISDMLGELLQIWVKMNRNYLNPIQMIKDGDMNIPVDLTNISDEVNVKITVGTAGIKEQQAVGITQMLALKGQGLPIPEDAMKLMIAELADIYNLPAVSKIIREHEFTEEELQEQQQQNEVMKADMMAELELKQTKAQLNQADAESKRITAMSSAYN